MWFSHQQGPESPKNRGILYSTSVVSRTRRLAEGMSEDEIPLESLTRLLTQGIAPSNSTGALRELVEPCPRDRSQGDGAEERSLSSEQALPPLPGGSVTSSAWLHREPL